MSSERQRRGSKTSVFFAVGAGHVVVIAALLLLASKEGLIPHNPLTVFFERKPKPESPKPPTRMPEKPAVKPEVVPAPEIAPVPATRQSAQTVVVDRAAPPPSADGVVIPGFTPEGDVVAGTPVEAYRSYVERKLKSGWQEPGNINGDPKTIVELSVTPDGKISTYDLIQSTGDRRWDDSVKGAIKSSEDLGRTRPAEFPERIQVRFDLAATETMPIQ